MYYIGIDIGGMSIKAGLCDDSLNILAKATVKTNESSDYKIMAKDIYELILKVTEEKNIEIKDVHSVGIGCPGAIDDKKGVVTYSTNINFRNTPLLSELQKYIDKPLYIGNDANCAAWGEMYALNDDKIENFVMVTLGTGVGGGVIANKKLVTGFNGAGTELGHVLLVLDGKKCNCGRKGCFEAYASATALMKLTREEAEKNKSSLVYKMIKENNNKVNGIIPFEASKKGDKTGIKIVDTYVKYLSEGIIDIINTFQPEVLAIGGGVSKQGEYLINKVREYCKGKTYAYDYLENTKIVGAKLGNDAGIIGAAYLGR